MLYLGKVVVFGQVSCFRAKVVVFGQSGFIGAKDVVYGQKWLFSGERFSILGKSGSIREKWLYLGKCGFNWAR